MSPATWTTSVARRLGRWAVSGPDRTSGGTRLYSSDDIERLHRIRDLLAAGLNLAGSAAVLELEEENHRLRARLARVRDRS